jgi:purine-binding chemotaxis protein CheW
MNHLRDLRSDAARWQILEERAHELARQQQEATAELGEEIITFRLGKDGYSVPAQFIREVYPLINWTPLPTTPAFVVGLVNVRGKLLTAIDVRALLGMDQTPPREGAFLVILNVRNTEIGLLADSMDEVRRGDADLSPTLSAVAGHAVPWVRGLDAQHNLVLDPQLLLADPRVVVRDDVE